VQVDRNVSANMKKELQRDDWDVMILHFLGLDHIGHLSGRHSSLVEPKLREMNGLIGGVYNALGKKGGRNMLVVFGDHGMTVMYQTD
jgi:ethanolamine phosphate transferase 2 subunit G